MSTATTAEDHARVVKRTLDAVFGHVAGAREAFPELAVVHDRFARIGLKALDAAPPLDADDVRRRLGPLMPQFGQRQIEAVVKVLTHLDRRAARRDSAILSTPTMFTVEVPLAEFFDLLGSQLPQPGV